MVFTRKSGVGNVLLGAAKTQFIFISLMQSNQAAQCQVKKGDGATLPAEFAVKYFKAEQPCSLPKFLLGVTPSSSVTGNGSECVELNGV